MGILSEEAVGDPVMMISIHPSGIVTQESIGSPQLNFTLLMQAIASAEAFGNAKLGLYLLPSGIVSSEALGEPMVKHRLRPDGIISGEAMGEPQVNFILLPVGIISAEAFGNLVTTKPLLYIQRYTIEVHDSSGNLLVILKDTYGISLEERINESPILTFLSDPSDTKLSYITRANEIWVRDVENNTVIAKTRLMRRDDDRNSN